MKKILLLLIIMLGFVALTACGQVDDGKDKGDTIEITHSKGVAHVPKNIEKAVVFDLGVLDIIMNLEVEVEIAIPTGNIPQYLSKFVNDTNLGTLTVPDVEAIFDYEPDVIFLSGRQATYYDEISKIAPTIYVETSSDKYLEDVISNMEMIGKVFNKLDKVNELSENLTSKVNEVKNLDKGNKTALVLLVNGTSISAYGPGSRFGFVHDTLLLPAADTTIEVSTHGQSVNYEYILNKKPSMILVVDRSSILTDTPAAGILDNEILKDGNGNPLFPIHFLNSAAWYLVSGGYTSTLQMINDVSNALK